EAECLVLAKEMDAGLLLLDEKRVRKVARRAGFDVMGVLGLLVRAARQGCFDSQKVVEMIDILRSSGFRLGDEVVKSALSALKK
ncbi:MAG: DUF3368 domain-containing protein, partial [Clostridia bacterium]|nr:DUF3368 domain-containing protein [Clostridia bacterium]